MLYMLGSIKFFPNSQWFLNVVKRETMYSKKQKKKSKMFGLSYSVQTSVAAILPSR